MLMTVDRICQRMMVLKRDLGYPAAQAAAFQSYDGLWRTYRWPFRRREGQIDAVADITSGTVSATLASDVIAFSSAPTAAAVGRRIKINSSLRDYKLKSLTQLSGPWEGATDAVATFEIRQMDYKMPPDFAEWDKGDESAGLGWVDVDSHAAFEKDITDKWATGAPRWISENGASTSAAYSTGTVAIDFGGTTVTLTSGTFVSARDNGRRFVIKDKPELGWWTFTYTSASVGELDRAYRGRQTSGIRYEIDPAGELLVRLYPQPTVNTSLIFKYFRELPPIQDKDDYPQIPIQFHEAWALATQKLLGLGGDEMFEREMARLFESNGLGKARVIRARGIDEGRRHPGRSILPGHFPNYYYRGR